jgi:hypothetical protein
VVLDLILSIQPVLAQSHQVGLDLVLNMVRYQEQEELLQLVRDLVLSMAHEHRQPHQVVLGLKQNMDRV